MIRRKRTVVLPATMLVIATGWPESRHLAAADLKPAATQAFERYVAATEERMERGQSRSGDFLYIQGLPETKRPQILAAIRRGEVWTEQLDTRDDQGREIHAPDGLITHWVGAAFFPSATIDRVLAVVQDFKHYQDFYKPEIVRSKLLSRHDDTFNIFLRVRKKTSWVSPTFNINSEVHYARLDADHVSSRSYTTRIAQVSNAGEPNEIEISPGQDSGYLWRLNSYWRFEQYEGGVIAEWEFITLSRDIPFLLRWIVRPFVERLARNTLEDTLVATRKAVNAI